MPKVFNRLHERAEITKLNLQQNHSRTTAELHEEERQQSESKASQLFKAQNMFVLMKLSAVQSGPKL